ncbi:L-histidine N(alpha)-methyltransferase [Streptomyces sp. NPDC006365]|uniref:L-histidine N(alpha)-methyltransferase n=1 Tax=Streptomyces sp. NPDC006365 TaxID=3364744 RepID=UPI0036A30815
MSPFPATRTLPEDATAAALRADVPHGLIRMPKTLPPKWFYDVHGSELFEKITELPVAAPAVPRAGRVASMAARGLRSCRVAVPHCVPFGNASRLQSVTRRAQVQTRPRAGRPIQGENRA